MKKIALIFALILSASPAFSQNESLNSKGCGTITTEEEISDLAEFVSKGEFTLNKTTAGKDSIPITFHLVAENDGSGRYRLDYLFQVVCELNQKYDPVGFYFYIKWPIKFINNSTYFEHNFNQGFQMMASNNVPNTVNVYVVRDPAGTCGYFASGPDAISVGINCMAIGNTTLTHEIGHYFGLPHTFRGWENGQTPNNPEKVTRGAGANCSSAGDFFCDTDADYLGQRWSCPYTGVKYDSNNDLYHPDSSLYMSYSTDACMSRFSNQQISRMQNRLAQRSNLLQNLPNFGNIAGSPSIIYPIDTFFSNYKKVIWNAVPNATQYHVKVTLQLAASAIQEEFVTSDTFVNLSKNYVNTGHYSVYIQPFTGADVCNNFMLKNDVIYSNLTTNLSLSSVGNISQQLTVAPQPVTDGIVRFSFEGRGQTEISLQNINGQQVYHQEYNAQGGVNQVQISTPNLASGVYFLKIKGADFYGVQKVQIQ